MVLPPFLLRLLKEPRPGPPVFLGGSKESNGTNKVLKKR